MYGIPEDFDTNFLLAKELIQVCVGTYQAALHFEEDISIYIESMFDCCIDGKNYSCDANIPKTSSNLLSLIGQVVESTAIINNKDVEVCFSSGDFIRIKDSNDLEESYQIAFGKEELVV